MNESPTPPESSSPPLSRAAIIRAKKWRKVRRIIAIVTVISAILVGLGFAGRYGYRTWQAVSARSEIGEAMALLDAGKNEEALEAMKAGYHRAPKDPQVLRGMGRIMYRVGQSEQSLWFWRRLSHTDEFTLLDKAEMAKTCVAHGLTDEARKLVSSLDETTLATRPGLEVQAALLRLDGENAEADLLLRRALSLEPDNPENVLQIAGLDLASPYPEIRERAAEQLWKLVRANSHRSPLAAAMLAESKGFTAPQSRELFQILATLKDVPERERYRVVRTVVELNPDSRSSLLADEKKRHEKHTPSEMVEYLVFLHALKEHDAILAILPEAQALGVPRLAAVYLESLASKERWEQIRTVLSKADRPVLPPSEFSILQARCSHGLKEPDNQIKVYIQEACRRALVSRRFGTVKRAAGIADMLGYRDLVQAAYQEASKIETMRVPALEALYALHARQRDPAAMLDAMEQLHQSGRLSLALVEQEIYLKALLGVELETLQSRLEELRAQPGVSQESVGFLKAFVLFRLGDLDAMRKLLDKIEPETLPVGRRAVYASLLHASGDASRAFGMGERILRNLLLPEEDRLLERVL